MTLSPEALAARYGDHYRKADRIAISAERFEEGLERGDDGGWGAGCFVVADERMLLVREGDAWLVPGGRVEADESPIDAAKREVREETGVSIEVTGLGAIAEQTFVNEAVGGSYEFYFATFVGSPTDAHGALDATATADPEIDEVAWHEEVPENTFDREIVERFAAAHVK